MAALGAVALGVYEADPAPTRSFAITFAVRLSLLLGEATRASG